MGYWITERGDYYEGDQIDLADTEVEQRPDASHSLVEGAWVVDPVKLPADCPGFISALKGMLGGIVGENGLAKSYPLLRPALEAGAWTDAEALIVNARDTRAIDAKQYASMRSLAAEFHLPVTLPE